MIAAGISLIEAGLHEHRAALEQSRARTAKLRAADELYKAGKKAESRKLVAQVKREQG